MSQNNAEPELAEAKEIELTVRRRWPRSVRALILLVLYVLSIGPMFWHWYEAVNMGGYRFLRVVYAPLQLLCAIPQIEGWLNRYIVWWIV